MPAPHALETKFAPFALTAPPDANGAIEGYAALFDEADRGGDVIAPGAFSHTLASRQMPVRLLWQHDPAQPIGVWDSITQDMTGLAVRGRLLTSVAKGAEAAELLRAGALDGLSIGYRAIRAERGGTLRRITEIDLWEISLVTFPMIPGARLAAPDAVIADALTAAAEAFR